MQSLDEAVLGVRPAPVHGEGAAWHVLPEIDSLHIGIGVIEVQPFDLFRCQKLRRPRIRRGVVGHVGNLFLCLRLDHIFQEFRGKLPARARRRDHQVINPSGGVFFRNGLADRKMQLVQLIGHQGPAHGRYNFMILKKICEFAAGGPHLPDVGLQFDQFFSDCGKLLVGQIVELRRVGFVVTKNLRGHIDGGKIVPN